MRLISAPDPNAQRAAVARQHDAHGTPSGGLASRTGRPGTPDDPHVASFT